MKKRLVAIAVIICLACMAWPQATESAAAPDDEEMTISIGSDTIQLTTDADDMLLQALCDRFHVRFEVLGINSTSPSDLFRLLAALNSLPDVLMYNARWDMDYLIQCGSLKPLPDSLTPYPNLSQLITYPYAAALQYDGHIWGVPTCSYDSHSGMVDTCAIFHKDIYDQAWRKDEPPATIQEWHELLAAIKALYPELIPLTSRETEAMFDLTYFYSPATYTWLWNGQRYIPGYYDKSYADSIKALKTLWDDQLIDPDFMNENVGTPSGMDKFLTGGAAGIMYDNLSYMWQSEFIPMWLRNRPEEPLTESLQLVFLPSDGAGNYYETYFYNITSLYFGSAVTDEKMARILTMLDWLCSDEGLLFRRFGLAGEDYVLDEAGQAQSLVDYAALYGKYPSYAFLRILPNQNPVSLWHDGDGNALTAFVTEQFTAWRQAHHVQTLFLTSLRANTVSTPAVLNFHPDILSNGFRMLVSADVDAEFAAVCQEYRDAGIELMINSIYYHHIEK